MRRFLRHACAFSAAIGMLAVLATSAAAATPTPPFNQCPPVGYDTSCRLLIVFNADGSAMTVADPSQGPYEGIEDTLIGVQNNSSATITRIHLTSPAVPPIFAFDGDGLCSGNDNGLGGNFRPPPTGCPFGPTGYEGPGSSFSNISLDETTGDVNFSPGIAPGHSGYFSLEGAVDVNQLAVGAPCKAKSNFRWHYSANGTSGSWSATRSPNCQDGKITIGPQAMEGDLKVNPGATLKVGYDLTLPGNTATIHASVTNPRVTFTVRCVSGATPSSSTFTVTMPDHTYTITNQAWYPSGDQHSSLVYQGSIAVPNDCAGGQLRLDRGGTFTASVLMS